MLEEFKPVDPLPRHIESPRLEIRQFEVRDAEEFFYLEQRSLHVHLAPYSPLKPEPATDAEGIRTMREMLRSTIERWEDGLDHRFAIILKESGAIIGQIGITNIIRNVAQSAFVGYWIGNEYLNRGYATEALVAVLHFSFELARLHRISLWIAPENVPSLRMAEKLNLRFEGTAIRALYLGGKWQDTKIFAITSEEWNERKNEIYEFLQHP
ncbi:MAG: GNAT family protein [Bacteroidota bacterium]|nr:GNAT family protein [Bacteroidota bacterium]MDP4230077.1 GNAT family protein [Bacteroidota bacterium]MDP4235738.1 GNAT family protein [Bacteroidota bacterium]